MPRDLIARLKIQESWGIPPLPITTANFWRQDDRYWLERTVQLGEERTRTRRELPDDEARPWMELLRTVRLPAWMEPLLVADGAFGTLELFSPGAKVTISWDEGLPEEARALEGFADWLLGDAQEE